MGGGVDFLQASDRDVRANLRRLQTGVAKLFLDVADDAEILGRRIEDTHTRKAAVELEGLREALRRAGYVRKQAATVTETERPDSRREKFEQTINRVVRQMRQLRVERLATVQRLAVTWTQALREWL